MKNEAYTIKYINQPSPLTTKHVYAKRQTRRQNECMQIDKYENEHDGGSKNKIKLRLIIHKLIIIG